MVQCHDVTYQHLPDGIDFNDSLSVVFGGPASSALQRSGRASAWNRSRHVCRPRRVAAGDETVSLKQRKDAASAFRTLFKKVGLNPVEVALGDDPDETLTRLFERLDTVPVRSRVLTGAISRVAAVRRCTATSRTSVMSRPTDPAHTPAARLAVCS